MNRNVLVIVVELQVMYFNYTVRVSVYEGLISQNSAIQSITTHSCVTPCPTLPTNPLQRTSTYERYSILQYFVNMVESLANVVISRYAEEFKKNTATFKYLI